MKKRLASKVGFTITDPTVPHFLFVDQFAGTHHQVTVPSSASGDVQAAVDYFKEFVKSHHRENIVLPASERELIEQKFKKTPHVLVAYKDRFADLCGMF